MSFYFTFWFYHFIYITAMALHSGHFYSLDAWSNYVLLVIKYCFLPDLGQYFRAEGDKYTYKYPLHAFSLLHSYFILPYDIFPCLNFVNTLIFHLNFSIRSPHQIIRLLKHIAIRF
jgi:hypothetical protein